jgi:hypothetical protein
VPGSKSDFAIVWAHLRAMQRGPAAEDELVGHFAEDGIYIEVLTSRHPETHRGRAEIRRALHHGLRWNPPDFAISIDRLEVEGADVVAHWTCTSAQLPGPMRGIDRYLLEDGLIKRLETRLLPEHAQDEG